MLGSVPLYQQNFYGKEKHDCSLSASTWCLEAVGNLKQLKKASTWSSWHSPPILSQNKYNEVSLVKINSEID